ncbi:hypothetical protein PINS_up000885 [Pythium insidiosum]|nr:hypothetical protein PINS_up000885 [Pythium insidiosum]
MVVQTTERGAIFAKRKQRDSMVVSQCAIDPVVKGRYWVATVNRSAIRPVPSRLCMSTTRKRWRCSDDTHSTKRHRPSSAVSGGSTPKLVTRPRDLHFLLPGLSGATTWMIFDSLKSTASELSWVSRSQPADIQMHSVEGWRTAVWCLHSSSLEEAVIEKSAMAIQDQSAKSVGSRLWKRDADDMNTGDANLLYRLSNDVRIVKRFYNRRETAWIEWRTQKDGAVCIMRKELRAFEDDTFSSEGESLDCEGILCIPLFVPAVGRVLHGASIQTVRKHRLRDCSSSEQLQHRLDRLRETAQQRDSIVTPP